ncbi:MAG: ABC-F family ATP-binding cassette domain-containing protein [Marinifilaceae bacterium]|nr:ABC-F family ATP-binding cassette domain-containing protein [Marinifilaceae bacterium]
MAQVSYLQVENLSKRFGENLLFENISFGIARGDKTALIAKNGVGKSTLLKIIASRDSAQEGSVIFRNDLKIGYLEQEPELDPENRLIEEIFRSDSKLLKTIERYELALKNNDEKEIEALIPVMDEINGWGFEATAKQILSKLNLNDFDKKISELSGGQRKRVGLAKVLINEPDFLLLDEPTNHLDTEMTEWLENYLSSSKATLLMVTHDRYFLDRVCNRILEIDNNELFSYDGNYSYYLEKREERMAAKSGALDKARNLFRTEQEWMRRMPQARSHKAQYRIDNFHKLQETVSQTIDNRKLDLDIQGHRLGKKILELENVSFTWEGEYYLKDFTYKFAKGDKVGIVGKNGAGKSTFLNIITGALAPETGSVEVGETVVFGYYRQEGITFNPQERVIDIVKKLAERIDMGNGRVLSASQFLEYFLFPTKQQYSLVEKLSGGERRRLYLLTVLIKNPNFLILDEPTNDLDIITLNVLEEYLKLFRGCLIVVSHDRYFTDKVCDRVFAFEGEGSVRDFPGNYTQYRNYIEEQEELKAAQAAEAARIAAKRGEQKQETSPQNDERNSNRKRKLSYSEKREMEQLEKDMEQLNTEKADIEARLSSGSESAESIVELSGRYSALKEILDEKEMRWLELSEI